MPWTRADIPDLSGTVAVVTGGNGGLGLETSTALAGAGADVVIAARNPDKAAGARREIQDTVPGASTEIVPLDLGSLDSVARASKAILDGHSSIDILVNNAGVMGIPERSTEDGFEMQLGVNHLGHFALTAQLLPGLLSAPAARVVSVTSTAHHFGRPIDPGNPHLEGRYGPWRAYCQSKLANFHFALGLHHRFAALGLPAASLVAHPGLSRTDLQVVSVRETHGGLSQRFFHWLAGATGMAADRAALPIVRAATDPEARSGQFYGPRFVNNGPAVRLPVLRRIGLERAIDRLWEVSEHETGLTLDLAKIEDSIPL